MHLSQQIVREENRAWTRGEVLPRLSASDVAVATNANQRKWRQIHISAIVFAEANVCSQAVEGLLGGISPSDAELALRYKDCHLIVLRGLQDPRAYGPIWTARHVTKYVPPQPNLLALWGNEASVSCAEPEATPTARAHQCLPSPVVWGGGGRTL